MTAAHIYGACGVEDCRDCLPTFSDDNQVLTEAETYVSGELITGVTAAGSHFTVDSRVDRYHRASSHVITGYTPNGRSDYYMRNVSYRDAMMNLANAERAGWTNLALGIEGF